jgi:hypothetical protein
LLSFRMGSMKDIIYFLGFINFFLLLQRLSILYKKESQTYSQSPLVFNNVYKLRVSNGFELIPCLTVV